MIIFLNEYNENIKELRETLNCLDADAKIMVFEENAFLPEGISSPYEYYISKQNHKQYVEKELHYDSLKMPEGWTIWSDGMTVGSRYMGIYYMGCERAAIYFRELHADPVADLVEPAEQRIVQRIEWRTEEGWVYRIDFYNKYGLRYASEFRDTSGMVETKVFYSDRNQEIIVEYPSNDVVTLLERGAVKAFFNSRKEFIEYFIAEVAANQKRILFIRNAQMLEVLEIKPDGEEVWDAVWFSDDELLDKYRNMGGKNGFRFYAIPKSYPTNAAKGEALILTRYDKVEKIEELARELPDVIFHIGANTMMSDTLMNLEKLGNVKLYPGLSQETLDDLWKKCDFYLDINLYGEIRDAVNVAQQKNLLVMGFDNTVHHRELLVASCVYTVQDYKKMILDIKSILGNSESIQGLLMEQQKIRKMIFTSHIS